MRTLVSGGYGGGGLYRDGQRLREQRHGRVEVVVDEADRFVVANAAEYLEARGVLSDDGRWAVTLWDTDAVQALPFVVYVHDRDEAVAYARRIVEG